MNRIHTLFPLVYAYGNQLNGTIPSEMFALPQLDDLQLHLNKLSGSIKLPTELTNTSLTVGKCQSVALVMTIYHATTNVTNEYFKRI